MDAGQEAEEKLNSAGTKAIIRSRLFERMSFETC